jgi:ABC-2 type transport system ATP-binding protein
VVDRSLTGRRNLDLHGRLWGVEPAEAQRRIEELVDAVGLRDLIDRPVGTYSGGERRRMEIARALVSSPRVLFLDEPTVALDPRIRAELLDILAGLRGRDELTILVTTHYLDEAEHLADRVAIMHGGRIVALDTPERLRAGLGRELVELRVDSDPAGVLATLRSRGIARDDAFAVGTSLTVPLNGHTSSEAIAAIQELGLAAAVSARQPTLDDVYLRLTGGRLAEAA